MAPSRQRWESLDPRIVAELTRATHDRLKRIAVAAAAVAVDRTKGCPAVLRNAVAELQLGEHVDTSKEAVAALAAELDDQYLDLQDDEKPGGRSPGWEEAFNLARAAAAVAYAYDADPVVAAGEAVYEGLAAIDDVTVMLETVTTTR